MPAAGGSGRVITEGIGMIPFGCTGSLVAGATRYLYSNFTAVATSDAHVMRPLARTGTLKNLFVFHGTAGAGAVSYRVHVNGADTGIIATVNGGATSGSDTTNTYDAVAGDLISLEAASGGAAPAGIQASLEIEWNGR